VDLNMSVTINRPVEAVFGYVKTFERWPEWRLALTSARQDPPGPVAVGTRVAAVGQAMGRSLNMDVEITDYAPNERIGLKTSGPIVGVVEFRFTPSGSGTQVAVVGTMEPTGVLKMAGPLVARQATEMWANDLAALKGVLEG
jgi:uncharacterized protein YndB with AHSA1/START domain